MIQCPVLERPKLSGKLAGQTTGNLLQFFLGSSTHPRTITGEGLLGQVGKRPLDVGPPKPFRTSGTVPNLVKPSQTLPNRHKPPETVQSLPQIHKIWQTLPNPSSPPKHHQNLPNPHLIFLLVLFLLIFHCPNLFGPSMSVSSEVGIP